MLRRHTLTITTADNQTKTIIPASVSSIRAWQGGGDIAVIYHGQDDYEVRLDAAECRQFIAVAWSDVRRQCPAYRHNACWFARQQDANDAPPPKCIKCQLTRIYVEARLGDPRMLPTVSPRSPLTVAFWGSVCLLAASWVGIQPYNKAADAAEYWKRRALRAESATTFKRQGEKKR